MLHVRLVHSWHFGGTVILIITEFNGEDSGTRLKLAALSVLAIPSRQNVVSIARQTLRRRR